MATLVSIGSRVVASIVSDNDIIKEINKEYKKITSKLVSPPRGADLVDDSVIKRGKYYYLDQAIEIVIKKFGIQELIVNKINEAKLRSKNAVNKRYFQPSQAPIMAANLGSPSPIATCPKKSVPMNRIRSNNHNPNTALAIAKTKDWGKLPACQP
jgi:hypothetical protein